MSESFDPYRVWLGIPPEARPPTHYQLLGISPNEHEQAVIEAAVLRQSGYVRNFQIGKYAKEAARVLNEIAAAKACLLDPVKRAKHDAEIKARQPALVERPALAAPARIALPPAPLVDIDLLAAAPPAPRLPGRIRPPLHSTSLLRASKQKRSQLAWQLPTGIAIGLAIILVAIVLWPRHSEEPSRTAVDQPPKHSGTVQAEPTPTAPTPPPGVRASEAPPAPPLAVAPFSADEARQHQERWAKYLGREVEETNSIGMKMVLIPPGEFVMGNCVAPPAARRQVRIEKPFYMGRYEVTQREYQRLIGSNPSWHSSTGEGKDFVGAADTSEYPVDRINWFDAIEFCNALSKSEGLPHCYSRAAEKVNIVGDGGYRLPTEAEWEFACRAGTTAAWYFGNDRAEATKHAWLRPGIGQMSPMHPVGALLPNPFSLYDLYGNVWEWCYGDSDENRAVCRGSSHAEELSDVASSGDNAVVAPTLAGANNGFRVVHRVDVPISWPEVVPQSSHGGGVVGQHDPWQALDLCCHEEIGDFARIRVGRLYTRASYGGPIEISIVARTNKDNIRVQTNAMRVIFNWEISPTELHVTRADGSSVRAKFTPLAVNTWYHLRWRFTANAMDVYVDDKLVFHESGGHYIGEASPVWLETVGGSVVDVKSFEVTPLGPPPAPLATPVPAPTTQSAAPAVGIDFPGEVDGAKGGMSLPVAPGFDIAKSWRLSLEFWAVRFPPDRHFIFFWGDERPGYDAISLALGGSTFSARVNDGIGAVPGPVLRTRLQGFDAGRWIEARLEYSATAKELSFFVDNKPVAREVLTFVPTIDRPTPIYLCHAHGQWRFFGRVRNVRLDNVD